MLSERLRRLRERFPAIDVALAVHERVGAIGGATLAGAIALAGFLCLLPLALVGIAVLGFLSSDNATFAVDLVGELGLEGEAADSLLEAINTAEDSRQAATVLGVVGLLWTGSGVVGALQTALNSVWQVAGRGLRDRLFAFGWLAGAAVLFAVSLAPSAVLGRLPAPFALLGILAGLAFGILLFWWTFELLSAAKVGWRTHVPGAIAAALGFEVLKVLGTIWLPRTVGSSSTLYGALGVVFGLLAWFVLQARLFVYAAGLNVVLYEREHGTVRVDLEVPRVEGTIPLEANRGGAVVEQV